MAEETGFRKWAPLVVMALALFIVVLDTVHRCIRYNDFERVHQGRYPRPAQ
ncbi:MAG: hypothetical protein WDN27_01025 [Candidatus Saccharibacteria bacterium]